MSIKIPGLNSNVFFDPVGLPFSQVSSVNPLNALTAAYYKLDGTSGPVIDSVAGNNGTNVGATRGVTGKIGDAFSFDGVNDYGNIDAALTPLASTTEGTCSAWVKPVDATPASVQIIMSFGDTSSATLMQFRVQTDGVFRAVLTNGPNQWLVDTNSAVFSSGVWTHVAIVQNSISPKLYLDGTFVPQTVSVTTDTTAWFNSAPLIDNGRIGAANFNSGGDAFFFDGSVDKVRIYDKSLTAEQIYMIYSKG
jgi:hypothetical protein